MLRIGPMDRIAAVRENNLQSQLQDQFRFFVRRQVTEQNARVRVTPGMKEVARKETEAGGYWSPDVVAVRVMQHVSAWSGNDPERLKIARDSVRQGFEEAERMLGSFADVTRKTQITVDQAFAQRLR